jgi:quercetin dioxygenase-like cupin family protein
LARAGSTIENPVNGERITWVDTAQSSGGSLLSFDLALRPDAAVAAEHRHLRQEERFTVTSGRIGLALAGEEHILGPGEGATVASGMAHRWWNVDAGETVVRVELRPALETEVFFETFFGLARDGKTNAKGIPGLLQIAVAYGDLGDSCPRLVKPPIAVQHFVFKPLAPIGRLLGRRSVYPEYSPDGAACGP